MRYFVRKLAFYLVAAWVAVTINFFLPRLIPGDPVQQILARESQGAVIPPGAAASLRSLLGLGTGNIVSQYGSYLDRLAHLDLGTSVSDFPIPVTTVLSTSILWTLVLVGVATIISVIIGIGLGAFSGWKRGTWADSIVPATTILAAVPYFWLALLLLYLLTQVKQFFPASGGYDPGVTIGFSGAFTTTAVQHALLPALTIVVSSVGGVAARNAQHDGRDRVRDYVLAAEARGLRTMRVAVGYAARNAVIPSIAGFAISLGFVVSGSLVMEIVFSYPGIGFTLLTAVQNNDYPLMQGVLLLISLAVLAANFVVDMLYGFVDPGRGRPDDGLGDSGRRGCRRRGRKSASWPTRQPRAQYMAARRYCRRRCTGAVRAARAVLHRRPRTRSVTRCRRRRHLHTGSERRPPARTSWHSSPRAAAVRSRSVCLPVWVRRCSRW